jgi:O-antigen/teichoic acid export membrane protein
MFGVAATASFQAALNVVNLANPILLGLCNVIPQAAARKSGEGYQAAWKVARDYALVGAFPLLPGYVALLSVPDLILLLLYGPHSSYLGLTLLIRILAVSWLLGYVADMICSFMHGVDAAGLALLVSLAGTLAAAALFLPLTQAYGLAGGCIALGGSNLVRLLAAQWFLTRMIAHGRPSVA